MARRGGLRRYRTSGKLLLPAGVAGFGSGVVTVRVKRRLDASVSGAFAAYEAFDARRPGWLKVMLLPQGG